MNFKPFRTTVAAAALIAAFSFAVQAEEPANPAPQAGIQVLRAGPNRAGLPTHRSTAGIQGIQGRAPHAASQNTAINPGRPGIQGLDSPGPIRSARGIIPSRNFAGRAYHGRLAWEGGRWHHEMHNGRMGFWWDVGGTWYFYPHYVEGPPSYVSDVEVLDDQIATDRGAPIDPEAYPAPPEPVMAGYPPPPRDAYPPGPDAVSGAAGGAIVGGVLGGLLTGRPGGAIAGAVVGGTTGAIVGAQSEQRRLAYFMANGGCYYRYPSGEAMLVDFRYCR